MGCDFGEAVHFHATSSTIDATYIERATRSIMSLRGWSNAHPEFAHPIMNLPRIRAAVTKNQAAPHRRFRVA